MTILITRPAPVKPSPVRRKPRPRPTPRPRPNHCDSWPIWTDRDRWAPTPEAASDLDLTAFIVEPRPTYEEPRPSPISEAWDAGFRLGYDHVEALPPGDMTEGLRFHWYVGHNTGWLRRESDDRSISRMGARRMDDDPLDRVHESELIEAGYRAGRYEG